MKQIKAYTAAMVGVFALGAAAHAQQQQLRVGATAPALDIEVVHGEKVTALEAGNVYIVEFWATWCGPCRAIMPALSEIQKEYGDNGLYIIGISDEDKATVNNYVSPRRDQISYTIAVDRNKNTGRNWMEAARLRGIPAAFIVDREQRIQFIGNPHEREFVEVLIAVLKNRYDSRLMREAKSTLAAIETTRRQRNWRMCMKHIDDLLEVDKRVFALSALTRFEVMLLDMDDTAEAYKYARSLLTKYDDDPELLVDLAEKIATDPKIPAEKRDLDVAQQAVDIAARRVSPNDPEMLAARALISYHRGDISSAVSLQRQAWMQARPNRKPGYERVLRSYQDAQQRAAREASRDEAGASR